MTVPSATTLRFRLKAVPFAGHPHEEGVTARGPKTGGGCVRARNYLLTYTVVCRRALGCEWGGGNDGTDEAFSVTIPQRELETSLTHLTAKTFVWHDHLLRRGSWWSTPHPGPSTSAPGTTGGNQIRRGPALPTH